MNHPPPPLPIGWTEHAGPNGQPYYFNIHTQESTYVRPLPTFPVTSGLQTQAQKERPLTKTVIPGTDWLRVKTTHGNVFYMHKVKKQSVWTVPDEIKEAVASFDREETGKKPTRVGVEEEAKRETDEASSSKDTKRKAVTGQDDTPRNSKKARVDDAPSDESGEEDESEEEEWQREAAAQLAEEAEEHRKREEEEEKRAKEEQMQAEAAQLKMPERVDLSIEEGKALFKTLLREKDINPLHPWDTCLPLFISDPRYVLLPSVTARREAFDEYCRDRARELRQQHVKKEKAEVDPKAEFDRLLKEQVTSTRTTWNDFRKAWKKNRQFYGWGRDDHEREKRFKAHLRGLGEKKRAAAQKAEADFFALLKENEVSTMEGSWKEIKQKLYTDPRYDAVGSSSLREELFNTFLKANKSRTDLPTEVGMDSGTSAAGDSSAKQGKSREERKARAIQEREEKIKADRSRVEADIDRSRIGLGKEEGEREFRTMLTDAIRDPRITWENALPQLRTDPRFTSSPLSANHQLHLFHEHLSQLQSKHLAGLHALFESHAPTLDTKFHQLPDLTDSLPASKLGHDNQDSLRPVFEKWQRERVTASRRAFDEMLRENSFVEFWGRLGKIGGEGVNGGVKADDEEEEEGEKVDMKALAKNVDVAEIEKVLKNDKRYTVFGHIPKEREMWVRDYLSSLAAPELSVHTRH